MRLTLVFLGLFVLISSEYAFARPLDDENNLKEGDDAAIADKRDKIAAGKDDAKKDPPKKDAEKPNKKQEAGTTAAPATTKAATTAKVTTVKATTKEAVTTKAAASTNPTSAPVTTVEKITTPAITTVEPPRTTPVATKMPPIEEEGDVENSANNTKNMNGTTFHVAIRFIDEKYSDDLLITVNPVYERTKQMVLTAIEKVYQQDTEFKQVVLIGFSDSENQKEENGKPAAVKAANPPGVITDMYLRFHTYGTHLRKLSAEIKTGKLDNNAVSPKFVRAYPAEPKGRVCTPDCKIQCYSYCDQGCCNIHTFMPLDVQSLVAPAPAPAPAPVPAPAPAPPPAPVFQPPAQPAPFPNYAPMPPPAALPSACPPVCNTYCAPQCPNECCTTYSSHPVSYPAAYPAPVAYPAPYPASYQAAMPAAYPSPYPRPAQAGCGAGGCGK